MGSTWRIGGAVADITPPAGTPMSGYPRVRNDREWAPDAMKGYVGRLGPSAGVHDSLLATALAIEVDDTRAVIVGLDTLVVTQEFVAQVRKALAAHGVATEHMLVAASHTHAGPDLFGWWDRTEPDLAARTAEVVAGAGVTALERLAEAECAWGWGSLGHVSVNRRDEEQGVVDPAVGVLRATSLENGEVIGLLVGYTCHPVTLDYANLEFSADYVGVLRQTLAAVYPEAVTVFLNGAAGNVNPARFPYEQRRNVYRPQTLENYPVYWGGFEDAARVGRSVAGEAVKAAERALPFEPGPLSGRVAPVRLPLKPEAELQRYVEFMNFTSSAYLEALRGRDEVETEVQALAIGPVRIVGLPGEPFVELGLTLKESAQTSGPVLVAGFANDDVRYVMTDDAYVAGQYETVGTPLAAGSASVLVERAAKLLAAV